MVWNSSWKSVRRISGDAIWSRDKRIGTKTKQHTSNIRRGWTAGNCSSVSVEPSSMNPAAEDRTRIWSGRRQRIRARDASGHRRRLQTCNPLHYVGRRRENQRRFAAATMSFNHRPPRAERCMSSPAWYDGVLAR
ncbi:hypothetical protein M758_UG333400 [Ceratodon purpureus]|nr:hypothetical protein M758_UG333400 [Ceratodon purpureus]